MPLLLPLTLDAYIPLPPGARLAVDDAALEESEMLTGALGALLAAGLLAFEAEPTRH